MNIVLPMAGRGSRLSGFDIPKPLIPIAGKPMVAWALSSLQDIIPHAKLIFVVLKEHEIKYSISQRLKGILGKHNFEIVMLDGVTEGQLCTVLEALRHQAEVESDLLIASCDTLVKSNIAKDITNKRFECRGIISVAKMQGNRWSFAKVDDDGKVIEVAEKRRISDLASTGLYYFRSTQEFISTGNTIINEKLRTNGEYYVISVYEKLIAQNLRIDISIADEMWDMGTPEALSLFLSSLDSK